jgi:phosphonate transport system permease protein
MTSTRIELISHSPLLRTSLWFVLIALGCLVMADLEITSIDPWPDMWRLAVGLATPDFTATEWLASALLNTVTFAVLGTFFASVSGLVLALVFNHRVVRTVCAFVRSIHELFWALIFLQFFGLTAMTGVLAIAVPFAGTCAKVYAEMLEEADHSPLMVVPRGSSAVSVFLFVRVPDIWAHIKTYSLYRLECGLRSSAVLGFVGLPTLGFHLETAFKEGHYSEMSALLLIFFVVVGLVRKWMRQALVPIYVLAAFVLLPESNSNVSWASAWLHFAQDLLPSPLRGVEALNGPVLVSLWSWFSTLIFDQALPGIFDTLVLTMIALVSSAILALLFFPLISPRFFGPVGRGIGHVFLVMVRSTPEYVLAFILLQLWGPSMVPAIVALSLHNGGIIGHLIGRHTEQLSLRSDSATGISLYAYEVLPRVYRQFLAFLFYRWEVILRETAILGMLGIHTLGFYVDSAFAEVRFDRAMVLIFITAMLNISVDSLSRKIRSRLSLHTTPDNV